MISENSMFTGWYNDKARPNHQHQGVVTTAQIEWELFELVRIYDSLHPRRVLEIGSQFGGTLWWWLENSDPGTVVVNIDILQNMSEMQARKCLIDWASWAPFGVVNHSIIGRSDDPGTIKQVKKYLPDGIDFLFIDALHTYEGVKHDFNTYGPMVRPGGIIALHDLITPEFSPHIRISDFWQEIQHAGYKTQELHANGNYGGIGLVYL